MRGLKQSNATVHFGLHLSEWILIWEARCQFVICKLKRIYSEYKKQQFSLYQNHIENTYNHTQCIQISDISLQVQSTQSNIDRKDDYSLSSSAQSLRPTKKRTVQLTVYEVYGFESRI